MAQNSREVPLAPAAAGASQKFSALASTSSLKRRRNLVKAACNRCRAGKVKCDGKRPLCGRCTKFNDGEPCEYDVDDGETRQDALRKKTAGMQKSLENAVGFLETLKNMEPGQLATAMANMRASSDVQAFLEQYNAGAGESSRSLSNESLSPKGQTPFQVPTRRRDARMLGLPNGDVIPQRFIAEDSTTSFFVGSSKLFHVFSQQEIQSFTEEIYRSGQNPPRTAMAAVFSIAAVGCAYMQTGPGQDLEELFFDRAKMCLDDVIESCPAKAAKVCCMLGMRLLFQKHRASLTFIEMGLELCRREGLDRQTKPFDQTEEQWRDGRKTWRTLFFFASWLSSSVGYLSKSACWVEPFGHPDVNIRGETSLEDLVRTAMVKVSLLKFSILRFNLDGNPLTSLSLRAMSKDLQKWYDDLPTQIHLINVQDPSIPTALRRTVYFCHLLYLGCVILLARRIIHSNLTTPRLSPAIPSSIRYPIPDSQTFLDNAATAAAQCARILSLLRQENGIFKRCWLCIFQAYVALTMNLYTLAQDLLARNHTRAPELVDCAAACLDILDHCRAEDAVATRFYSACLPIFTLLSQYRQDPVSDADLQKEIERLLEMFCMPFSEAGDEIPVIRAWQECEPADTRLHEYSLVVGAEQTFEASQPFHRRSVNVAPGLQVQSLLQSLGPSRFLHDPAGQAWPDALMQG